MASRNQYRKKYLRYHKTYEKRATNELIKLFKKWFNRINWENENYVTEIENNISETELFQTYVTIYKEIGKKHGVRVLKDIKKEKDDITNFLLNFEFNVEAFLRQYGLERVKTVQRSLYDDIINLIATRLEEGKDIRQVAKEIQKIVNSPSFYRWRALRIARTETTAASNYAAIQSAYYGQFEMVKEWISAHDARTRRKPDDKFDHFEMDAKRVGMKDPFIFNQGSWNEDKLMFPGDPKGQAGNVINCRCTVAVVAKRDKDGNLIPKSYV